MSNFSVPKRIKSEGVYIYNNLCYAGDSEPLIGFIGKDMHLWNNIFVVEDGGLLARNLNSRIGLEKRTWKSFFLYIFFWEYIKELY